MLVYGYREEELQIPNASEQLGGFMKAHIKAKITTDENFKDFEN
jgi:hypothetical protein